MVVFLGAREDMGAREDGPGYVVPMVAKLVPAGAFGDLATSNP
jgi:hypothetical protein